MFVQMRKITVAEGFADQVAEQFRKPGIIEQQEGFVDLKILVKKARRGDEEVVILITWESEEHWKKWEKSDAHIAGHKQRRNEAKPEYILNVEVGHYEVKAVKQAAQPASSED
ncbi:antibiotic biosynthesis monooxygenase [Geobacillus thermocatenulatus]|uniref:Antibiotic biosynthesis monooxygenase n=1 Tax=Geobacillus thermocatenulatus TaxID=33938 RepID=A0A226Q366_9BACL|nr:antibiotic biosynthesis monooxygenase [Geobacillus thermocatenulatus]AST00394.1 antibiotic biosynthesis monooxygenase [Geobacillus thermocatenulatus]OXB86773.1 antibiotic biosynthesis monooxygenase [Geobacillus thermocatenulatus]